jgi:hypothetical protein
MLTTFGWTDLNHPLLVGNYRLVATASAAHDGKIQRKLVIWRWRFMLEAVGQ